MLHLFTVQKMLLIVTVKQAVLFFFPAEALDTLSVRLILNLKSLSLFVKAKPLCLWGPGGLGDGQYIITFHTLTERRVFQEVPRRPPHPL